MVDDKFRGTKADLERWIDWVDDKLRHVPHDQTVRYGNGPERRLTMREMFPLERLDRLGPDAVVTVDRAPFERYWRQTMLSCFPPEKRSDSDHVKRRLQKKGAHLIALPAVSVPVLCASGMHFKAEAVVGVDEYCVVKVSTLPVMYRRKKVLGKRTRYRQDGQIIFCYGDPPACAVSFMASVAAIRRTCTTPSAATVSMSSAGLRKRPSVTYPRIVPCWTASLRILRRSSLENRGLEETSFLKFFYLLRWALRQSPGPLPLRQKGFDGLAYHRGDVRVFLPVAFPLQGDLLER